MRASTRLLIASLAVLLFGFGPGPSRHRSGARPAYRTHRIVFARSTRLLRADVVVPNDPGPHPLVVLVHGGAWRRGRRADMNGTMRALAERGYAAATVDYRLAAAPRTTFPGPISDVRCAVRTLRAHASELGIDPRRFAAVGFSAGAHLAALLATASDVAELDDGSCSIRTGSPAVQAVVGFYGPYDLRLPERVGPGADGAITNLLGVSRRAHPELAALASPITHVDPRDPPTMLIHGLEDRIVEVQQTRRMRDALEAAGVPVVSLELPGRSHGFGMFPRTPHEDDTLARATLAFLDQHLAHHPTRVASR